MAARVAAKRKAVGEGQESPKGSGPFPCALRRPPVPIMMRMTRISTALSLLAVAVVSTVAVAVVMAWWVGVTVAGVLLLAALTGLGRAGGRSRWLAAGVRRRFSRRAQSGATLSSVVGGLVVDEVAGVPGPAVAVARDPAGWFAIGEIVPSAPMADEPAELIDLAAAAEAAAAYDIPGLTVQAVTHVVNPRGAPGAADSYRELVAQLTGGTLPAGRTTWVVARVDALAWVTAGRVPVAATATAGALRRILRSLASAGVETRPLAPGELREAITRSLEIAEGSPDEEQWSQWVSGGLTHRTFRLRQWPAPAVIGALAQLPAPVVAVTVVLAPGPAGLGARCLVRIAAPAADLPTAVAEAERVTADRGVSLVPLDGEQAPGAYATAPTGGGPW